MAVDQQTIAGAGQFTGAAGLGLVEWDDLENLPRTEQICFKACYRQPTGALDSVRLSLVNPNGPASAECVLLVRTGAEIVDTVGGGFAWRYGPELDPRNRNGLHWRLVFTTVGKTGDGTLSVDSHIVPLPERDPTVSSANVP